MVNVEISEAEIWSALENVKDPEIPVISVVDMGMITGIEIRDLCSAQITMTPTFVGCPAIDLIKKGIREEVLKLSLIHISEPTRPY